MRLLLDTHAILWFFAGHARLSDRGRDLIDNQEHQKLISVASV